MITLITGDRSIELDIFYLSLASMGTHTVYIPTGSPCEQVTKYSD